MAWLRQLFLIFFYHNDVKLTNSRWEKYSSGRRLESMEGFIEVLSFSLFHGLGGGEKSYHRSCKEKVWGWRFVVIHHFSFESWTCSNVGNPVPEETLSCLHRMAAASSTILGWDQVCLWLARSFSKTVISESQGLPGERIEIAFAKAGFLAQYQHSNPKQSC